MLACLGGVLLDTRLRLGLSFLLHKREFGNSHTHTQTQTHIGACINKKVLQLLRLLSHFIREKILQHTKSSHQGIAPLGSRSMCGSLLLLRREDVAYHDRVYLK